MDVLIALLIVLLFAALPMQPYTASGRGHYPSRSNEPKPVPHASEPKPRTKPLNGKFEAEVEPIYSELRSQFRAKWEADSEGRKVHHASAEGENNSEHTNELTLHA